MNKLITLLKLNRRAWVVKDQQLLQRFWVVREIASKLLPEYRFKWPHMEWWKNRKFNSYLAKFNEADSNNIDRRWTVYQLLRLIEFIEGDTAEIGVYHGAMSHLIIQANKAEKHHHIFDSFEGLSIPQLLDGEHWRAGDLACTEDTVKHNLSNLVSRFTTYKGWVPERFDEVADKTFSFIHIDVDIYQPTRDSIAFFYPRMNPGGIIVCDDYGFTTCPGATKACDDFLSDKPEKMIALPDGGGFLLKGIRTGMAADLGD